MLRPLLLAAGFSCVTSWDRRDAGTFPLRWITRNAEAVVDLMGCTQELAEAASDHSELIIITPDAPSWTLLALTGLLRAAATAQDPTFDIAAYHACALDLVATTPPDRLLPNPRDTALTSTIEQTTTQALRRARPCAEHTDVPFPHSPRRHPMTATITADSTSRHRPATSTCRTGRGTSLS